MRGEAILIFSLSTVSTAIRGLGGGSPVEALGGSARSGDKLTERESSSAGRKFFSIAHTQHKCCTNCTYLHRNGLN